MPQILAPSVGPPLRRFWSDRSTVTPPLVLVQSANTTNSSPFTINTATFTKTPKAGNLLVIGVACDKNGVLRSIPAGFSAFFNYSSASVTMYALWKQSDGTESGPLTVTKEAGGDAAGDVMWIAEFASADNLDSGRWALLGTASVPTTEATISTCPTGTTPATKAFGGALAFFSIDSFQSTVGTPTYSNGFNQLAALGSGGRAGLFVALGNGFPLGSTVSCTMVYGPTADQVSTSVAVFNKVPPPPSDHVLPARVVHPSASPNRLGKFYPPWIGDTTPPVAGGALTGSVAATITETDTVTAVVAEFGAVTATVTSGSTVTAVVGTVGAVTATVTSGSTVTAVDGKVGAVTATVTETDTVTATVTSGVVGSVTATVTCGSTVTAVVGAVGAVTATITCGATVAAVVGVVGAVSVTVTCGSTVTAVDGKVGAVSATVTCGSTVSAAVTTGPAVTVTVTSGSTVTAAVGVVGSVTTTVTTGNAVTGVVAKFATITSTVTAGSTVTAILPAAVIDVTGRVTITQTVASTVDAGGPSSLVGATQTTASTAAGQSAAAGTTRIDPTTDGRGDVG